VAVELDHPELHHFLQLTGLVYHGFFAKSMFRLVNVSHFMPLVQAFTLARTGKLYIPKKATTPYTAPNINHHSAIVARPRSQMYLEE
jgi:hypothetical protein